MMRIHVLSTALFLASAVCAQNVYVPDSNSAAGTCNVIPFGHNTVNATWSNQRYQCMVTTADMGANTTVASICDLAFAPCVAGIRHCDSIEIIMGQTSAATLSTTFSANLVTNVKTVLKATNWDWHNDAADTWTRIGLDTDYLYLQFNGNIVVQITVTGAFLNTTSTAFPGYRTGARERLYGFGWTGTPPSTGTRGTGSAAKIELVIGKNDLNDFGVGCKGTAGVPDLHLSGSATIGTGTVTIDVQNCPTTTPLLHVFGLTRYASPVDLGFAGAPGCNLYQTPDLILGGITTSTGTYRLAATVPNDRSIICVRVYTQAFPVDARANTWGRTSSNYGRILPGL